MKTLYSLPILAAVAAMLAFSVPAPAFSEMKDMAMKEHKEGHGQMMEMRSMDTMGDMMAMCIKHADKMGLSEEQMVKMKTSHREMQKQEVRFKADVKIAEIELMEVMDVKDFDLEKAGSLVKKIEKIKADHHLEMLKAMKEMRTALTDEQFKKMKAMMSMKMDDKKAAKKMMKKQ